MDGEKCETFVSLSQPRGILFYQISPSGLGHCDSATRPRCVIAPIAPSRSLISSQTEQASRSRVDLACLRPKQSRLACHFMPRMETRMCSESLGMPARPTQTEQASSSRIELAPSSLAQRRRSCQWVFSGETKTTAFSSTAFSSTAFSSTAFSSCVFLWPRRLRLARQ